MKTFQLLHGIVIFETDKIKIIDHESNGKKWLTIISTVIWITFFTIRTIKDIEEIRQNNNYDNSGLYLDISLITIWIGIGIYFLIKKSFQSSIDISNIVDINQTSTITEGTHIVRLTLSNNRVRKLYFVCNDDLSFIETLSQRLKK